MKTTLITLILSAAAAVALFGGKAVRSHVTTLRDDAKASVRSATPADYEARRIRTLIASMTDEVLAFSDKIAEVESSAAAQRRDIQGLESQVAQDRTDLVTERNLLAQDRQTFEIRGKAFSRAQVEASAQARLARMERDRATLETKQAAVERLESAVREGRARLQSASEARDAKLRELELLEAQFANAALSRELQTLAAPLDTVSLTRSQGELAESMKAFGERVRREERQAHTAGGTRSSSVNGVIAHNEGPGQPGLLDQIDRMLTAPADAR
ncbi:MAG: hypothetical protein KF833_15555 [Verrucomicrobiae bacterium]|nr:hypothetical protein [Verrucomicrobiae bacterium]